MIEILTSPSFALLLAAAGAVLLWLGSGRRWPRRGARGRQREPHIVSVAAGAMLVIFAIASLGAVARDRVRRHKPVWWLQHDLNSGDEVTRAIAFDRLAQDVRGGNLSAEQTAQLIAAALAAQQDRGKPWDPGWGSLIEAARDADALHEAAWQQYVHLAAAGQPSLTARPRVRRGLPVPVNFNLGPQRAAFTRRLLCTYRGRRLEVDGAAWEPGPDELSTSSIVGPEPLSPETMLVHLPDRIRHGLSAGRHTLRLTFDVAVLDFPSAQREGRSVLQRTTIELMASWELVEAGTPTVRLIRDEGLLAEVQKRMRLAPIATAVFAPESEPLWLQVHPDNLPVAVSADALVRAGGGETIFPAPAVFPAGAQRGWSGPGIDRPVPDDVAVVLRPNVAAAERTVEISEICGDEITLTLPRAPGGAPGAAGAK